MTTPRTASPRRPATGRAARPRLRWPTGERRALRPPGRRAHRPQLAPQAGGDRPRDAPVRGPRGLAGHEHVPGPRRRDVGEPARGDGHHEPAPRRGADPLHRPGRPRPAPRPGDFRATSTSATSSRRRARERPGRGHADRPRRHDRRLRRATIAVVLDQMVTKEVAGHTSAGRAARGPRGRRDRVSPRRRWRSAARRPP